MGTETGLDPDPPNIMQCAWNACQTCATISVYRRLRARHTCFTCIIHALSALLTVFHCGSGLWWYESVCRVEHSIVNSFSKFATYIVSNNLGLASKLNRRFRPVSIVFDNGNRPEPDGTASQLLFEFEAAPYITQILELWNSVCLYIEGYSKSKLTVSKSKLTLNHS